MEKGGPKTGTDQKSQRSRARRTPQLPSKDRRRGVGTTSEAFKARRAQLQTQRPFQDLLENVYLISASSN